MKKLGSAARKRALAEIDAIPENGIDTSDIPELTAKQMRSAMRGLLYRPMKTPVTIRLDRDVIDWLKSQGPGYQTRVNRLLRTEMLRSLSHHTNRR